MTMLAMRVRMLRGTGGPDGLACEAGEVYDLPRLVALQFLASGRAEVAEDAPPTAAPVVLATHDRQAKTPRRR